MGSLFIYVYGFGLVVTVFDDLGAGIISSKAIFCWQASLSGFIDTDRLDGEARH